MFTFQALLGDAPPGCFLSLEAAVRRNASVAATRSEVAGYLADCTRPLTRDVADETALCTPVAEEGDARLCWGIGRSARRSRYRCECASRHRRTNTK